MRPSLLGLRTLSSEPRFGEVSRNSSKKHMLWSVFFLGAWPQNSKEIPSHRPRLKLDYYKNLEFSWNFNSRKLRRVLKEYKAGRHRQQQTSAFRCRRRSPPELGHRGECPTRRHLQVLLLSLGNPPVPSRRAFGAAAPCVTLLHLILHADVSYSGKEKSTLIGPW